ncbi:MAG: dephospho-CoA kinase [Pseudomonadota bacterium]|nr:dephospho-CoA kinase [Pseudomonadota bacterium]
MADFVVALTGGIASGKSAVCERLAVHGAVVVDADVVSRELVAPGQPALAEIVGVFGPEVIDSEGALRRRLLRERVFNDVDARLKLEAILHPRVREILRERASSALCAYAAIAIPLLIESGHYHWVDRIVAIDVDEETQVRRLMQRDSASMALARAMLAAQAGRRERLLIASDVLINDADLFTLERMTDRLHTVLHHLAQHKSAGRD